MIKYKARFVARGFTPTPDIDFHNTHSATMPAIGFFHTYSHTTKLSTFRTVLACGMKLGMHLNPMDMKTAYLDSPIQTNIYVEQPDGYQKGKRMICKLRRSLYGLKKLGRNWLECTSSHGLNSIPRHQRSRPLLADTYKEWSQVLDSGLSGRYSVRVNQVTVNLSRSSMTR